MQVTVGKWGNSAALRIPNSVMQAAHLTLDQAVDIREENGRIVIEPVSEREYTIEELMAGVTDENMHPAIDMGPPVGKEVW
jgi:antitoxin MazE